MKEPTEARVKEFWEWCEFRSNAMKLSEGGWNFPKGGWDIKLPPIDLNNLFKYAVPKLQRGIAGWELFNVDFFLDGDWITCRLEFSKDGKHGLPDNKAFVNECICTDPALALFWAIWEVLKG